MGERRRLRGRIYSEPASRRVSSRRQRAAERKKVFLLAKARAGKAVEPERQAEAAPAPPKPLAAPVKKQPEVELVLPCEVVKCPPQKRMRMETGAKDAQSLAREDTAAKDAQERAFRIPIGRGDARERLDNLRAGRSGQEESDMVRSGWVSSASRGRAQSLGARGEAAPGARKLASTVSVPSSSTLRAAASTPVWIAGVEAATPSQPPPAVQPTLISSVVSPSRTVEAPAASFSCKDIRQDPKRMAELEQQLRSKAKKASQHISMVAQLRQDREEMERRRTPVCAPVRTVQVKRDVSSRAEAAPRAADKPQVLPSREPRVVVKPLTDTVAQPVKSALKRTTTPAKPVRTEEERLQTAVKYVKATEAEKKTEEARARKGKVRFVGVESKDTSTPSVLKESVQPSLIPALQPAASSADSQLEAAAAQYLRYVPPPRPQTISEAMLKTMAHLVGEGVDPVRVEPFPVRVDIPAVTADYCQHHLAFKVLDALERPASLPSDRAEWLDYLTQEIAGSEEMTGTYAFTRISVGAMLAFHEWMTDGADLRKRHRDSSVSLPMRDMIRGIAAGDKAVSTVMSSARLDNFLDAAFQKDQPLMDFLASSSRPSFTGTPQEAAAEGQGPSTSGGGVVSVCRKPLEEAASVLEGSLDTTLTIPETQLEVEMEESFEVLACSEDVERRASVQGSCIAVSTGCSDVLLDTVTQSCSDSATFVDLPTLASSPLVLGQNTLFETWQDLMMDMPTMDEFQ